MRRFEDISIEKRFKNLLLLICIIFIILTFSIVNNTNKLTEITSDINNHPLEVSNGALESIGEIIRMHRSMKDVVLSDSMYELDEAVNLVNINETKVYKNLDLIREKILGEEGRQLERDARLSFEEWKSIRDEVLDFAKSGNMKEASFITKNKGADHVKKLEKEFSKLYSYARNKSEEFESESKDIARTSIRLIISALIITIIIISLVVYLTYKSIWSDLNVLKNGMKEIVETKTLKEINLSGQNEIVDMATDFNILVAMLKLEIWKKERISTLQSELINTKEFANALNLTLQHIIEDTGSITGALFLYNQKSNLLKLKSNYGNSNLNDKSEFKINEGIIGHVGAMKEPIYISNLSENESEIVLESGIISNKNINTFIFPIVAENDLLGVIEIGALNNIETTSQEYLLDIGKVLGSYLLSAKQKHEIKKYNIELTLNQKILEEKQAELENLNQTLEEEIQEKTILEEELRTFTEELEIIVDGRTKELSESNQDLQQLNTVLEEEIEEKTTIQSELKKIEKDLIIARDKEMESNLSKSAFLANMSHEIRTPMNGIIGMLEVLNMTKLNEEQLEYLKTVKTTSKTLLYILNDILDYSKIEAGKMEIRNKEFSVRDLIDRITLMFTPLANDKNLNLYNEFDDDIPDVLIGDEARIQQIISNLVSNAIKFTESGEVSIKVSTPLKSHKGITLKIVVTDTGRGIKETEQVDIFKRFSQLNESGNRKTIGSGLGLSISKALVELMNGKIELVSKLGVGSEFSIEIMLLNSMSRDDDSSDEIQDFSVDILKQNHKILIVEDDFVSSKMLELILKKNNYISIKVRSGEEALESFEKEDISLVLMDINLPGISGYETTKKMKKLDKKVPIIAMTANALIGDSERGLESGMDDYLTKPIEIDEFFEKIEKYLV
ncbi:MAG: ATP-binding protein [Acidaminobacteraceae bacterium]